MANNLFANRAAAVVAKSAISFVDAGITALNTRVIYKLGTSIQSYVPGRSFNAITAFEADQGYYIIPIQGMDLSAYLAPPLSGGGGGGGTLATPGSFSATPGNTQNFLDWADVTNATSYTVDRATNSGFTTGVSLNRYTGSTSAFTDTGLTNGTQYFYRVKATAVGYTDSSYATANGTPATGGSALPSLVFTDRQNLTGAAPDITASTTTDWVNFGIADQFLEANTDGYVQYQWTNADQNSVVLGFSQSSTKVSYTSVDLGFYSPNGTTINAIFIGGVVGTSGTITNGHYYRLNRTGSVTSLQESVDGVTFTTFYTFGTSATGRLYVNLVIDTSANHARNVKGFNLT